MQCRFLWVIFSKKLSEFDLLYSTYNREFLAVFVTGRFFQRIPEIHLFIIYIRNRPLVLALMQLSDKISRRQLDFISQLETHMEYTPGVKNAVADALFAVGTVTCLPLSRFELSAWFKLRMLNSHC